MTQETSSSSRRNSNVKNEIVFTIPRHIEDIRKESCPSFQRAKLVILRMDEQLIGLEKKDQSDGEQNQSTCLRALADATNALHRFSFREMLSIDERLPNIGKSLIESEENNISITKLFRQREKCDPITDFHQAQDFLTFDQALTQHRMNIFFKPTHKLSDMSYLKFCIILEILRDESESCLRILLHDIIFKVHLADFRLRCQIHVRKPIEHELILERIVHDSHLNVNYSAEFILWSGDWITQQEVELYIVMKIESLSINKYITSKFSDMAHLHVKNIPHGASRIFLRELTPVCRPHKILSRGINIGQVEIEAAYWSIEEKLSIHIIKVSHSHSERLLRSSETYVEILFQTPFDIYDIKRMKISERSSEFNQLDEIFFQIPDKLTVSDITIDLIFREKSSLHHHAIILGVLTLSKHTDWYPVRKFWIDVQQNPNIRLKDRFLFEGNIYD